MCSKGRKRRGRPLLRWENCVERFGRVERRVETVGIVIC